MAHEVTLITGDGTGPELAEAARKCIDGTGASINWDIKEAGVDVMEKVGTPIPDETIDSVRRTKCALKAPITTPVGTGFRSINVYLRQELGLFACIRPCKHYPGVRSYFSELGVDIVIVRENTEDLYAGVEFEAGKPETSQLIEFINSLPSDRKIKTGGEETGVSIKPISKSGTARIVRCAFDYAKKNGRNQLYCLSEDDGDVVLIEATSNGWHEKGRFTLSPQTELRSRRGKIWTHPVIANGKLYLRDQELVYCYDIKRRS